MKKRAVIISALILVLVPLAFTAGFGLAWFKYHHTYEVFDEKSVDFLEGKVHLRQVFETNGYEFMTLGKSVIEMDVGNGLSMLLYKAQRGFQEPDPYVDDVKVNHHELSWEDGWNHYHLEVEPIPRKDGPANAK